MPENIRLTEGSGIRARWSMILAPRWRWIGQYRAQKCTTFREYSLVVMKRQFLEERKTAVLRVVGFEREKCGLIPLTDGLVLNGGRKGQGRGVTIDIPRFRTHSESSDKMNAPTQATYLPAHAKSGYPRLLSCTFRPKQTETLQAHVF